MKGSFFKRPMLVFTSKKLLKCLRTVWTLASQQHDAFTAIYIFHREVAQSVGCICSFNRYSLNTYQVTIQGPGEFSGERNR